MSALAYFAPEFIQENRFYWLHAPLYVEEIENKENYYFTDEELNKAIKKGKVRGVIGRNKGLGEMSAETARNSMFTEKYQRMELLEYSDEAMQLLHQLMGVDVTPRRNFIIENVDFSEVRE